MPGDSTQLSVSTDPRLVQFVHVAAQKIMTASHLAGQVPADAFGPVGRELTAKIAGLESDLQQVCVSLSRSLDDLATDGRQAQNVYHESDTATATTFRGQLG